MPYISYSQRVRAFGRIIAAGGDTMTLKRAGQADIVLKGKRVGGSTETTGNAAVQQAFRVKIGVAELDASAWPSKVPVRTDSIVIGGRTRAIRDVRPLMDGTTTAGYDLDVAG
jgi:hypothetical protein